MANERILVVEDQKLVAEDISAGLKKMDFEVVGIASTGEGAIKKALDTHPDLVLMDIRLKGEMDGIEAASRIREKVHVPVVYLTAYTDEKTLKRAKVTEPFGYLIKPFEDRELFTTLEMALYKHKMDEKLRHHREELEERVKERTSELTVAIEQLQAEVREREAAESELRETKEYLENVLDSTAETIFSFNDSLELVSWNKEAERIFGYKRPDVQGRPLDKLKVLSEAKELVDILKGEQGKTVQSETILKTRDGKRRVFRFGVSPLVGHDGEPWGTVVSGKDVTIQKQQFERVLPGSSYIIKADGIESAGNIIRGLQERGLGDVLIITRRNPDMVEGALNLGASYLQLSGGEKQGAVADLADIKTKVGEYLKDHPDSVVLLDRIDYLITTHDFQEVLLQLYLINDMIMGSNSIFLINLPPDLLSDKENTLFLQEFQEFPDLGEIAREKISYEAHQILMFISSRDVTTLKDIAEKFSITRPTVNKKVEELREKGLVKTRKKGLYKVLILTDQGQQAVV